MQLRWTAAPIRRAVGIPNTPQTVLSALVRRPSAAAEAAMAQCMCHIAHARLLSLRRKLRSVLVGPQEVHHLLV
jgi:hypothetical protein